ncbi:MAG: hypothetical protein HY319_26980 [Armatimonadetes bacterium]|nr:hypothetical protein [Armatimonadota bacterium]
MRVTHARPAIAPPAREHRTEDSGGLTRQELYRSAFGGSVSALAGAAYPSIYAHELGHKLAVDTLYQNAQPTIEVNPFSGGVTRWFPGELTETGQKLGPRLSRAVVSAAGTVVDTTIAMTSFAVGYRIRKEHPLIGTTLMGYAGFTMLNSVFYAASALGSAVTPGNDFASLALNAGIHPLVSMGILAAVLPAEYLLLRTLEKHGI